VVPVSWEAITIQGQVYSRWQAPNSYAGGWHDTSAPLSAGSNIVLNGHHNAWGQVFGQLVKVQPGDQVFLYSQGTEFAYTVVQSMILPERDQPLSVRVDNARWLLPTPNERVTLITCWPENDNSHRLVVIAIPKEELEINPTPALLPTPLNWQRP
jgi:sortase A